MKSWPGEWEISEFFEGGAPGGPFTRTAIRILAEGGTVATLYACENPRRAFNAESMPDCGGTPGTEGYQIGLEIARATAREIIEAHNAKINGRLNFDA